MSKRKPRVDRIEVIKGRRQELDDRIKELLKEERIAEKKKRDRRISKRGGLLESISPDTIPLTDEQFNDFLQAVLSSDLARRTLDRITAKVEEVTAPPVVEVTPEVEEVGEVVTF
jgi:hypothetical protein